MFESCRRPIVRRMHPQFACGAGLTSRFEWVAVVTVPSSAQPPVTTIRCLHHTIHCPHRTISYLHSFFHRINVPRLQREALEARLAATDREASQRAAKAAHGDALGAYRTLLSEMVKVRHRMNIVPSRMNACGGRITKQATCILVGQTSKQMDTGCLTGRRSD